MSIFTRLIATGEKEGTVRLWNWRQQQIRNFPKRQNSSQIWDLSFSRDNGLLAAGEKSHF